jgi:hypothetical protein
LLIFQKLKAASYFHASRSTHHAVRSTQSAARGPQHAVRSTQSAVRSPEHAVRIILIHTSTHKSCKDMIKSIDFNGKVGISLTRDFGADCVLRTACCGLRAAECGLRACMNRTMWIHSFNFSSVLRGACCVEVWIGLNCYFNFWNFLTNS